MQVSTPLKPGMIRSQRLYPLSYERLKIASVSIVDDDGGTATFQSATQAIGRWQQILGVNHDTQTYNAGVALINKHPTNGVVLPGAKERELFVSERRAATVKNVFVMFGFSGQAQAFKK